MIRASRFLNSFQVLVSIRKVTDPTSARIFSFKWSMSLTGVAYPLSLTYPHFFIVLMLGAFFFNYLSYCLRVSAYDFVCSYQNTHFACSCGLAISLLCDEPVVVADTSFNVSIWCLKVHRSYE